MSGETKQPDDSITDLESKINGHEMFRKLLKNVDFRGHFLPHFKSCGLELVQASLWQLGKEKLQQLLSALNTGQACDSVEFTPMGMHCINCGSRLTVEMDGVKSTTTTACAYPVKRPRKTSRKKSANFTTGQVIARVMRAWPNLHSGPDGIMIAADHIMCAIGTGVNWHPNGFAQYDYLIPDDTSDMAIPKFDKPFSWNQLCEYSAVVIAAGLSVKDRQIHLNASFAALARNVLECMINHGTVSPDPTYCYKTDPNIDLAKQCLEKINQLYPPE